MSYARHPDLFGGAADAQRVGRARAAHAMERQRPIQLRDCCGPTANPCESGIRAPSRGRHPLPGQASAGNALGRYPRPRIRSPSWWERYRRNGPRTPSRGTPAHAITSGGPTRPSGVVPPNQRMQPDAVPASEIGAILRGIRVGKAFPINLAARLMRRPLGYCSTNSFPLTYPSFPCIIWTV